VQVTGGGLLKQQRTQWPLQPLLDVLHPAGRAAQWLAAARARGTSRASSRSPIVSILVTNSYLLGLAKANTWTVAMSVTHSISIMH
jgi:hypothetical protein